MRAEKVNCNDFRLHLWSDFSTNVGIVTANSHMLCGAVKIKDKTFTSKLTRLFIIYKE